MAISSEFGGSSIQRGRTTRHGTAFMVEALVVLWFLMMALAVFVNLFSSAQLEGMRANNLSQAVILATNRAEEFSANPTQTFDDVVLGDLTVSCEVSATPYAEGTLFDATIVACDASGELYTLRTARYVAGGETA